MRIFLISLASTYMSCSPVPQTQEVVITNNYNFGLNCEVHLSSIELPSEFKLKKSEYSLLFTNYEFTFREGSMMMYYFGNSSDYQLHNAYFTKEAVVKELQQNYDLDKKESSAKVDGNRFIKALEVANGYCYMIYEFPALTSVSTYTELFNYYSNKVRFIEPDFRRINLVKNSKYDYKIISLKSEILPITNRVQNGTLYVLNDQDLILQDYNLSAFNDCDELLSYYTELIMPYYQDIDDGSTLTVVIELPTDNILEKEDVMAQFIIRKNNSNENPFSDFGGTLGILYLSDNVVIKYRNMIDQFE